MSPIRTKQIWGGAVSLTLALGVYWGLAGTPLAPEARGALAAMLVAVTWWSFAVIPPAFTSMLLIAGFLVAGLAPASGVLSFWSGSLAWLMVGSFLLARAVSRSGLARRIALVLLSRFVHSYPHLILAIFLLNLVLAPLVPLPFPRAFVIMAVVKEIVERIRAEGMEPASLGFAVFLGAIPPSMMFLTGDAVANGVVAGLAGGMSWLGWFKMMAVPALAGGALMLAAHRILFPPPRSWEMDREFLTKELGRMGGLSGQEIRVLVWIGLALAAWVTDSFHGIDPGWVALLASVGLSLPWAGGVLDNRDLSRGVDWPVLIFCTGAMAIGAVGQATGLAEAMAGWVMPASPPASAAALLGLLALGAGVVRLFVGSVLATMSLLAPPLISLGSAFGLQAPLVALTGYVVVYTLFALPFHHLIILSGAGDTGGYGERETLRMFPAQIFIAAATLGTALGWWSLLGLL